MKLILRPILTLAILAFSIMTTQPPAASAAPSASHASIARSLGGPIIGYHAVRPGETLFCIGRAYAVSPWAIAAENGIGAPYTLGLGRVLAIPIVAWPNLPAGPTCVRQFGGNPTPPPPPPPACRAWHTIASGDTLSGIARRFNADLYTLAARNNIYNLNLIFAGTVLCIP